jgi:hypothetical protein
MNTIMEFKRTNDNLPEVKIGEILWVDEYNTSDTDFVKLPFRVLRVYANGSWDGELEEAEA